MIVKNESVKGVPVADGILRRVLATHGSLMMAEIRFSKGAMGDLHSHYHEQVGYIVSGCFEFELDGLKIVLNAGDSYYVKPNAVHGIVALEDSVILDVFTPQREEFKYTGTF